MSAKKEILDRINALAGEYSPYQIFSDWVQCCALAICNACHLPGKIWNAREKEYLAVIGRHSKPTQVAFAEMFATLPIAYEEEGMTDILGEVYMEGGFGSGQTGQFFTPFNLSELTARLCIDDLIAKRGQDGKIWLHEPSVGGGAMVIAAAKVLKDAGINYQRELKVVAQDLDWRGVYTCYTQLSLLGIRAKVVQGDTLADPYRAGFPRERILETPAWMGVLVR